ncbi:MAG: hypothetical protein PHS29_02885 [Candidatus Pacebacteria bacterium]|nr:hypothetical protein [Candidatus Paceibacterota bacterium]
MTLYNEYLKEKNIPEKKPSDIKEGIISGEDLSSEIAKEIREGIEVKNNVNKEKKENVDLEKEIEEKMKKEASKKWQKEEEKNKEEILRKIGDEEKRETTEEIKKEIEKDKTVKAPITPSRALPPKPSSFKKFLIRFFIFLLSIVFLLTLAFFLYWFLILEDKDAPLFEIIMGILNQVKIPGI